MPLIWGIVAAIATFLGKLFTDKFVQWVAIKALILFCIVTLLPLVLKDVIIWAITEMMNLVYSSVDPSSSLHSFTINLSGVAGYLGSTMQLPLCLSIILTALGMRLILNFIPFIK